MMNHNQSNGFALIKGVLLACLLLHILNARSQSKHIEIKLDRVIQTGINYLPNPYMFSCAIQGHQLFWIPYQSQLKSNNNRIFDKALVAYCLDLRLSGKIRVDTIRLFFRRTKKPYSISNYFPRSAGVSGDYVMVPCSDKHRIFKKHEKGMYYEESSFDARRFHLDRFYALEGNKFYVLRLIIITR